MLLLLLTLLWLLTLLLLLHLLLLQLLLLLLLQQVLLMLLKELLLTTLKLGMPHLLPLHLLRNLLRCLRLLRDVWCAAISLLLLNLLNLVQLLLLLLNLLLLNLLLLHLLLNLLNLLLLLPDNTLLLLLLLLLRRNAFDTNHLLWSGGCEVRWREHLFRRWLEIVTCLQGAPLYLLLRYGSSIGGLPLRLLLKCLPLDLLLRLLLWLAASSDNALWGLRRHAGPVGCPVPGGHGQHPLAGVRVLGRRLHRHLRRLLAAGRRHHLRPREQLLLLLRLGQLLLGGLLLDRRNRRLLRLLGLLLRLLQAWHCTLNDLLKLLSWLLHRLLHRLLLLLLHLLRDLPLMLLLHLLNNDLLGVPERLCLLARLLKTPDGRLPVHCLLELLHRQRALLLLLLTLKALHQQLLLLGRQLAHLQLTLPQLHHLLLGERHTALGGPRLTLCHKALLRDHDGQPRWKLLPLLHLLQELLLLLHQLHLHHRLQGSLGGTH